MRFSKDENVCWLTLFSLVGVTELTSNVSSTSIGQAEISLCDKSWFFVLGSLISFFFCFGRLAVARTSTGISLIPREYTRGSHSISLAVDFRRERLAPFTVSLFRGIEQWVGLQCRYFVMMSGASEGVLRALGNPEARRYVKRIDGSQRAVPDVRKRCQ